MQNTTKLSPQERSLFLLGHFYTIEGAASQEGDHCNYSEWISDCCLTPMSNFLAIWWEQVKFNEMMFTLY